ncbi:MAG: FG-GAP-like repeat-containing protein [Verrucomicrobia bacterium]|nr:FG-GAP-like repeat-containing protein [Verrucomicrobiota bacterium]
MLPLNPLDRQNTLPSGRSQFEEPEFRGPPQHSWNTLLLNDGGAGWYDVGPFSGLAASGWSWAVAILDLDLDGLEDVLITNGVERDGRNRDISSRLAAMRQSGKHSQADMIRARSMFPRLSTADMAFRNLGNLQFEVRPDWGFNTEGISNGMALGDLDNDGDLDIIVNHLNRPASILRNNSTGPRVQVRLVHQSPNTCGIGATVHMRNGEFRATRQISAGGRYLSSDQPVAVFPVPHPDQSVTIDVHWPDGISQVIEGGGFPGILEVYRGPGIEAGDPLTSIPRGYREKSSPLMNQSFVLAPPSSSMREPITGAVLPEKYKPYDFQFLGNRFSPGPQKSFISGGARWIYEMTPDADVPISTGLVHPALSKDPNEQLRDSLPCDGFTANLYCQGSDPSRPSGRIVLVGREGRTVFEQDLPPHLEPAKLLIAPLGGSQRHHLLVAYRWNYQNPARPPGLTVFSRNLQDEWVMDTLWTHRFADVGITQDIETADLDQDAYPELIVPGFILTAPRILSAQQGQVVDKTLDFGLHLKPGPWISITCLDHDGDPQTPPGLLFGNSGGNNSLPTWGSCRVGLLYPLSQLTGPVIEVAEMDDNMNYYPLLSWDQVSALFPFLGRRFPSIHEFSRSPVAEWIPFEFGIQPIETLDTALLVPDGVGGYRSAQLPASVQLFPVRDAAMGDLNRDGIRDLVIATGWHHGRTGDPMHDHVVFPILLLGTRTADDWIAQLPHQSGFSYSSGMAAVLVDDWDRDGSDDVLFLQEMVICISTGISNGM